MSDDDLAVLLFIAVHFVQHGRPPRIREIARDRGLSYHGAKSTVRRLRALWQLGGLYGLEAVA